MEEDTGKTTHGSPSGRIHDANAALLDFNRAGVPLVECVSEPDIRSPEEAAAYLRELRATLESLDVSDVRMEEGSLRCDANVSMRPVGTEELGTKVEIKNMNSVRSLERALAYEIARQTKALEAGESIVQETRHWNEDAGATESMRSKEEAFDYRYFPEPDIPAIEPSPAWIEELRSALPELPRAKRERYVAEHGLKPEVARVLVADRSGSALFEGTVGIGADPVAAANWITQDLAGLANKHGAEAAARVTPQHLADLLGLISGETISGAGAKQALEEAVETGDAIGAIVERKGLRQVSDAGELGAIVDDVLAGNADAAQKFRDGNDGVIGFLVGQVMKASGGSANPKLAQDLLRERLRG
jgi:aspartyl-tRNA(Asn)/glutamyl-tRNA(Gln) amidotransferase subunit B